MSDFFGNIDTTKAKIPLQKNEGGVVRKKKSGRPRRPNMERYIIKMDKSLHARLVHYANSMVIRLQKKRYLYDYLKKHCFSLSPWL